MRSTTLLTRWLPGLAAAAATLTTPATAADAAAAPPVTPACAWSIEVSANALNVAYPDTAAAYWVLPFTVQSGLDIKLAGRYPASRYISLQVYKPGGGLFSTNGVGSGLADYRIQPERGSVNPWQHPAPSGGRFTVTMRWDPKPGERNTLPVAPAGTTSGTGYLIYRVYLPARGNFSRVPLPAVTFERGGVAKRVPRCPATNGASASVNATVPGAADQSAAADSTQFARPGNAAGVFSNADSAYLASVLTPPGHGDVMVIRGKAPTSSSGSHPSPWPARGRDMQYWSMCTNLTSPARPVVVNHLAGGGVDYGCRHDSQVRLDRHGYYTFVVGTEAQRAAIERIPGVTFLPFSSASPAAQHVILLRNMVVSPAFAQAVQNVPDNDDPAAAAGVMGAYYPRSGVCPLATLAGHGPAACLAATP